MSMCSVPLSDKVAELHDINYALAKNEGDIRLADQRMVNKLKEIERNKQDSAFNIKQGQIGIKTKMALEDIGIPKSAFTTFGDVKEDRAIQILESKRQQLEQEGFGKPVKKKKKTKPVIRFLKQAKKMYGVKKS